MIRYALLCEQEHAFEGWFGASADFDDQRERGLIECPSCGSKAVRKAIMAPAVAGTKRRGGDAPGPTPDAPAPNTSGHDHAMMMEAASRLRAHVEENFDDMGDAFAREARAIHEGRSEERGIYGQATGAEVKALVEDGVPVAPLPPEAPKKSSLN